MTTLTRTGLLLGDAGAHVTADVPSRRAPGSGAAGIKQQPWHHSRVSAPAIVVDGVGKSFSRPHHRSHTFKERALHPFRRTSVDEFVAVKDVSFAVEEGEFFGIVGRNGSGKSTLLKLLAGIYGTTTGDVWIRGRLSTFIELGVGFNPDLAARDNVILNAIMLGLTPAEARARYEKVIAFAELEEFQDVKLKNYSSGMHVRLAFAVMIQVDADVLLIDEVLAVGDAAFQQKCFDEFNRLRDEGRTIVFVSHDMGAVRRFCDRAILMEEGVVVDMGAPDEIGSRYLDINFSTDRKETTEEIAATVNVPVDRHGDGRAEILDTWLEDADGNRTDDFSQGDEVVMQARVRFHHPMRHPSIGVAIENDRHDVVLAANSIWQDDETGVYRAGDEALMTLRFENVMVAGRHFVSPAIAERGAALALADHRVRVVSFISKAANVTGGTVDLPYTIGLRLDRPGVALDAEGELQTDGAARTGDGA
jgi:ABC-type polysaccharide/polyol phosphate transport system ATPase subunit